MLRTNNRIDKRNYLITRGEIVQFMDGNKTAVVDVPVYGLLYVNVPLECHKINIGEKCDLRIMHDRATFVYIGGTRYE